MAFPTERDVAETPPEEEAAFAAVAGSEPEAVGFLVPGLDLAHERRAEPAAPRRG